MQRGLYEILFAQINRSLEASGLKVRECEGAVIDATIIVSASRPQKTIEAMPEDRNETKDPDSAAPHNIRDAKDPGARWLKKGNKSYFGYKGFVAVGAKDGDIEKTHATPANKSEVRQSNVRG
jgi:transposase, IS5 family